MLGCTCQNTKLGTSEQKSGLANQDDGTKGGRCCSLLCSHAKGWWAWKVMKLVLNLCLCCAPCFHQCLLMQEPLWLERHSQWRRYKSEKKCLPYFLGCQEVSGARRRREHSLGSTQFLKNQTVWWLKQCLSIATISKIILYTRKNTWNILIWSRSFVKPWQDGSRQVHLKSLLCSEDSRWGP